MKRLSLFVLVLAAFGIPSAAHAAVPCRDRIYNDWYADGKIATSYPVACYKSALTHIPQDAKIYSNLSQDIQTAMQAAIAHTHGKTVPAEVGGGEKKPPSSGQESVNQQSTTTTSSSGTPSPTTTLAASETSSNGSSVPLPIIVLGAVAILLAAAGAVGAGVRHFRGRRPSV